MVQKSCVHQLRLVDYPIIYLVYTSQVVVWDFFHQQYFWDSPNIFDECACEAGPFLMYVWRPKM